MNNKEIVLKEMFGKNDSYAGYDSICNKLIETGSCISTIHASKIFRNGGVHNFVEQELYEGGVDLIKLSINKEYIYSSELFNRYKYNSVERKRAELNKLMSEVEKLQSFINELE